MRDGKRKIILLDLDGTLWNFHSGYTNLKNETEIKELMFAEVPRCLRVMKRRGFEIGIASASPRKDYCLKYFDILFPDITFDFICIECESKINHFRKAKDFFQCEYTDMYFFDDQQNFLNEAKSLNINAINASGGLKFELLSSLFE